VKKGRQKTAGSKKKTKSYGEEDIKRQVENGVREKEGERGRKGREGGTEERRREREGGEREREREDR